MKYRFHTIFITFLLAIFSFISVNAQKGYEISVENRIINGVDSTVFVLEVDRAIDKDVSKAWKKIVEKKGKIKSVTKNDLTTISGITMESIDEKPLDIYSKVIQQDTSVRLYAVFIVDNERVDPNGVEGASVKVRKFLSQFGADIYKEVLEREVEEKESKLEDMVKAREKNLKTQDNLDKSIQRDSLKISSEETEIGLLKGQLQGATDRYTTLKNKIAKTNYSDKDLAKEDKSKLKEIEKERKGIEKDIQKHTDEILDLKSEIRDYWYELKQHKVDLEKLEEEIITQRKMVKYAQKELELNG